MRKSQVNMKRKFADSLPPDFVRNVTALCGDKGKEWLDRLPNIISKLQEKWAIKAVGHFHKLSYNYVANALSKNGESVVLKIGLPLDDVEIYGEAAYLKALNGQGSAKLLNFDSELQAVLLERLSPGNTLKSVYKKDQGEAVSVAINILKRILRPVTKDSVEFTKLDDWFDGLKRASQTEFPHDYAEKALTFYKELSSDSQNIFLLHGDLHHDNILSAAREPFLVIDPKGLIGHVGYDIGVFLNNHYDWLEWDGKLEHKLDDAVGKFAEAFELDESAIRKFAFCQMVLSRWWMFDEMSDILEDFGLSDIWKI